MAACDPAALGLRDFGRRLAAHRSARGVSQLQLGLAAQVSARHISFLETGRAQPSRDMVRRLAAALELAPAAADLLMVAGGHAPSADTPSDALTRAVEIQEAAGLPEALALTRQGLAPLGLGRFFVGELTPARRGAALEVVFRDTSCAHTDWLRHYRARGYRPVDPLVAATAACVRPFFWQDVLPQRRPRSRRVRDMLGEAADFGLTGGFVLPIPLPDGRVRALSAMGEAGAEADPRLRWEARLLALALLERPEFAA